MKRIPKFLYEKVPICYETEIILCRPLSIASNQSVHYNILEGNQGQWFFNKFLFLHSNNFYSKYNADISGKEISHIPFYAENIIWLLLIKHNDLYAT
jgi:hypothetical protein